MIFTKNPKHLDVFRLAAMQRLSQSDDFSIDDTLFLAAEIEKKDKKSNECVKKE